MKTCEKCKRTYSTTHTNRTDCPYCRERETQTIKSADVDTGSVLSAIIDGVSDVASSIGSSVSDTFDGGGGDFGGGGASGDW